MLKIIGALGIVTKGFIKGQGSRDHQNYIYFKISQTTEKSPEDLSRDCYSNSSKKPSANAGVIGIFGTVT